MNAFVKPYDEKMQKTINVLERDYAAIRLVFPPLTEERRKELCKQISKMGEESKVAIRSIRRDANDKLKAQKKEMPEDVMKDIEKEIQDVTDKRCKEIDKISAAKEKEIMEV